MKVRTRPRLTDNLLIPTPPADMPAYYPEEALDEYRTPGGKKLLYRKDSNDTCTLRENFTKQGYTSRITPASDDRWLDVGGHIGSFPVAVADQVDRVFSFEPYYGSYWLLHRNLVRNKIQMKCAAYNLALVGNDDPYRMLYLNRGKSHGTHSLLPRKGRAEQRVQCVNINAFIRKFNVNAIKMDCEGAEWELIGCLDASLWLQIREIVLEFHHEALRDEDHSRHNEVLATLQQHFPVVSESNYMYWGNTSIIHATKRPKG